MNDKHCTFCIRTLGYCPYLLRVSDVSPVHWYYY